MNAGPVDQLLDPLASPVVAFRGDADVPESALRAHQSGEYAVLAKLYAAQSAAARRNRDDRRELRMLLAERAAATVSGDRHRAAEAGYFVAQRHRLRAGFCQAEAWNHALLATDLDAVTAVSHARAWRELAALREVAATYDEGLAYCERALAVCKSFPDSAGIPRVHVQVVLQQAVLHRLRGAIGDAVSAVRRARQLSEDLGADVETSGHVALREGGIELAVGRGSEALAAYQRAEELFMGKSHNNVKIAQVRQITCLRAVGQPQLALALSERLRQEYAEEGDRYRLGQVVLEEAEVLHELGRGADVADVLEAGRPLFESSRSLEAVRWHRHRARHLIETGGDLQEAAGHLAIVLTVAAAPDRRDLTRTMLGLFDLTRLRDVSPVLRFKASRAALLAADLQRDDLGPPQFRWAMHEQREEVYSGAILVHADVGNADGVAQITETGRADVLHELLRAGYPAEGLDVLPMTASRADPDAVEQIFETAAAAARALGSGASADDVPELRLPDSLPPESELDELGDVVIVLHVGTDTTGWFCATSVREKWMSWRTSVRAAGPAVASLLERLSAGEPLPQRGIAKATWEALSAFLLPDEAWTGSPEHPPSVVLCPDPRLWQLPFAALPRDSVPLAETAELLVTPSLRTSELLKHRLADPSPTPSGPAVSILDPALPGHELEVDVLDTWSAGHRSIATLTELGDTSLLYVADHGVRTGQDSLLTRSVMTLADLARAPLPPLVVLNGCWSGTAESRYGTDPLSLAVGALIGGAYTVIAGSGAIGSAGSALVSSRAMALIISGTPVCAAVRQAQREIRSAHPELGPSEWAGLFVVGVDGAYGSSRP
ncbi:CHAT domain-containing protein [Amycolatopsis sp. A133]|uniref:CHAT domain-containing protein n=1 Tax=Amycolatopsis sp. A133 TaxID=3064472 RepID=UPI0027EFF0E3|nr:CHAT domain-containing protein [Amycolatopsis sp. A133]MDQ7808413.1 CHAT domain-containing protein [Amycolatopsis sp. A133]